MYQTPVTLGGFWTSPSVSDPVLGYDREVQPRPQVYPPWNTSRHFANDVVLLDSWICGPWRGSQLGSVLLSWKSVGCPAEGNYYFKPRSSGISRSWRK